MNLKASHLVSFKYVVDYGRLALRVYKAKPCQVSFNWEVYGSMDWTWLIVISRRYIDGGDDNDVIEWMMDGLVD